MKGMLAYLGFTIPFFMLPTACLFGGISQEDVVQRMYRDLAFVENTFQAKYGPLNWKETALNWNLATEIENAQTRIAAAPSPTLLVYRQALKQFLLSMKDYHVDASFYCTESASLPFSVAGAEGRYFIVSLQPDGTNSSLQRLNIGDEILTFDGVPIQEAVAALRNSDGKHSNPETDERLAQLALTWRSAAAGFTVPSGTIHITVRSASTNSTHSMPDSTLSTLSTPSTLDLPFTWDYRSEQLHVPSMQALSPPKKYENSFSLMNNRLMQHNNRLFLYDHFKKEGKGKRARGKTQGKLGELGKLGQEQLASQEEEISASENGSINDFNDHVNDDGTAYRTSYGSSHYNDIGERESFLPPLGKIMWQSSADSYFDAYLFQISGKLIGYIRIPSYEGDSDHVAEFASTMELFQNANTAALVIDQLNNPGGSFFYFYALASHLTNQPLVTPKHHVTMTQGDFVQASQAIHQLNSVQTDSDAQNVLGSDISGYPVSLNLANQMILYNAFLVNQWNSGKTFTDAHPLFGITTLPINLSSSYTKPIIVLVNGLDFSCGDFFPALLQDNQRALLFGSRTAGAGGFIAQMHYPTPFGTVGIQYTASIAQRANTHPIENLGVTPDVVYTVTPDDLQFNYRDYVKALLSAIETYLQSKG